MQCATTKGEGGSVRFSSMVAPLMLSFNDWSPSMPILEEIYSPSHVDCCIHMLLGGYQSLRKALRVYLSIIQLQKSKKHRYYFPSFRNTSESNRFKHYLLSQKYHKCGTFGPKHSCFRKILLFETPHHKSQFSYLLCNNSPCSKVPRR